MGLSTRPKEVTGARRVSCFAHSACTLHLHALSTYSVPSFMPEVGASKVSSTQILPLRAQNLSLRGQDALCVPGGDVLSGWRARSSFLGDE